MNRFENIANPDGTYKTIDLGVSSYMETLSHTPADEQIGSVGTVEQINLSQTITAGSHVMISGSSVTAAKSIDLAGAIDRINNICDRVSKISRILSMLLRTRAARYFTHNEFNTYADMLDNIAEEIASYNM